MNFKKELKNAFITSTITATIISFITIGFSTVYKDKLLEQNLRKQLESTYDPDITCGIIIFENSNISIPIYKAKYYEEKPTYSNKIYEYTYDKDSLELRYKIHKSTRLYYYDYNQDSSCRFNFSSGYLDVDTFSAFFLQTRSGFNLTFSLKS